LSQSIPVNPAVLLWARETAGLSVDEVVRRLGRKTIDAKTITSWEEGSDSPNFPQLESLAYLIYKRPLAVFFFPTVPEEETPKTDFRTLPEAVIEGLPSGVVKFYRKAKLLQLYLEELYEGSKPVEESLLDRFELNEKSLLSPIARQVRDVLGISVDEQTKWLSGKTAFDNWRDALERNGVFVFKDAFRNDDYSGFCLFSDKYPVIFVNNSMPASRQVFTLFHELGHLLYRAGGVDFRTRQVTRLFEGYFRDTEVNCNQFANEFLVPGEALDSLIKGASEEYLEKLATHFSVSREVILRNYLDRGLVDNSYYEKMAAKWASQAKESRSEGSGGNSYYTLGSYLGRNYIEMVYAQYYRNRISRDTLAEYLGVKERNLSNFEYWVVEGGR
jgi:Zn-dependent peptidase ImmA (M78 family)/transcriptional regulator with XRE-family HTH domain